MEGTENENGEARGEVEGPKPKLEPKVEIGFSCGSGSCSSSSEILK